MQILSTHEKEKLRQRKYDAKRRANTKADEEKAAKQREYKREWMRKKRAEQKAAKIDKDSPETSSNG